MRSSSLCTMSSGACECVYELFMYPITFRHLCASTRSFVGYTNMNCALSEVRDPVRTIKRAAPLAMISVTVIYLLVNIAYFAVVPKEEILNGGRIVAWVIVSYLCYGFVVFIRPAVWQSAVLQESVRAKRWKSESEIEIIYRSNEPAVTSFMTRLLALSWRYLFSAILWRCFSPLVEVSTVPWLI